jgi:hypothetical protein
MTNVSANYFALLRIVSIAGRECALNAYKNLFDAIAVDMKIHQECVETKHD